MDGILAVKAGELSSAEPRFTKKIGLVQPVPPTLRFLDDTWASCFNSHHLHSRIRRKQHVRLASTRRLITRGYAASCFDSQSSWRGYAIIPYLRLIHLSYSPQHSSATMTLAPVFGLEQHLP